jgi:hypothetical protein
MYWRLWHHVTSLIQRILPPLLAVAACTSLSGSGGPEQTGGEEVTEPVQVDRVDVIRLLTYPVRIHIVVHGERVEGVELDVDQERRDDLVIVTMTQTYPRDKDTRKAPFQKTVPLKGAFPPGEYRLEVNDHETTFTV